MKSILLFLVLMFLFVGLVSGTPGVSNWEVTNYNLSVSDSLAFEQTFNASNVTSLSINVTDDATKSDPYDINTAKLVSWWKFDDDYLDSSVNGYDGTAHGDTHFVNVKYENGSNYDGTGDYVSRTTSDYRINDVSGSISFFINTTTTQTSYLFSTSDESTTLFFAGVSVRDTGKIALFLRENFNDTHIQSTNIVNDGVGHIVHIESTGNSYNIYIDNEKESLNIVAGNNNGVWFDTVPNRDNIIVGGLLRTALGLLYTGDIDNLMIYNSSLTTSERNILYYDHLQQLQIKTNSNATWSSEWNSTTDNPTQIPYTDGEFFNLLNFTVPDTVVQNGITLYDYPSTIQFDATAIIEYFYPLPGTFLYPNSTGSGGCYGKLISELVYETGFNFSDIGSCNALTTGDMEVLSVDDTNYIPSIDKDAAHDGYMYGNFSLPNVESVNFINVKTVHNRNETNPIILGLFNTSTQKWHAVNNSSVEIVDVELTYNITGTDIAKYTTLTNNVLNLSVSLNTNGDGNYNVFVDFVEVYIDYEESPDITLEYVYNLTISNQNNITILQNDFNDLENNVNNLYMFVLLCTVFLVAALRKRGD